MALSERVKIIMTPTPPKSEDNIADAIEKWEDQANSLKDINKEYELNDLFKRTALRTLMVGKAKDRYEMIDTENEPFVKLLRKCKEYAAIIRLEVNSRKDDPMDIGRIADQEGDIT